MLTNGVDSVYSTYLNPYNNVRINPSFVENQDNISELLATAQYIKTDLKKKHGTAVINDGKLSGKQIEKSLLSGIFGSIATIFSSKDAKKSETINEVKNSVSNASFLSLTGNLPNSLVMLSGAKTGMDCGEKEIAEGLKKAKHARTDAEAKEGLAEIGKGLVIKRLSGKAMKAGCIALMQQKQDKIFATALYERAKKANEDVQNKFSQVQDKNNESYLTLFELQHNADKARELQKKILEMCKNKQHAISAENSINAIAGLYSANSGALSQITKSMLEAQKFIEKSTSAVNSSGTYLDATEEAKSANNAKQYRRLTQAKSFEASKNAQTAMAEIEVASQISQGLKSQLAASNCELQKLEQILQSLG